MPPTLYLNKTPPSPAYLSPAFSIAKSAGLNQNPDWPILDVDPVFPSTEFQRLQAVAGNDDTTATANNVRVQLWAYACTTAAASGLYLTSMGGTRGVTVPAGGAMPINIGPGQEQPFSRAWDKTHGLTSTDPEITSHFVNNEVHCCIFGNVYNQADAASAAIPDVPTGPAPLLQVATNRHHAQRNMTIKVHGTPKKKMGFHMFAGNPDPEQDQVFMLQLTERPPRKLPEWQLDELAALGPWIRRTPEAPGKGVPGIEFVMDGERYAVGIADERLEDLEMDIKGEGGRELKLELGADEARPMELNATVPDEPFVLRIIDVHQTQGDTLVGGARIMLMTVPDELLEPPKDDE